jgi:protein associated with RNAse G/E
MFEREIKFIYDFNVNQVKKLGTSFTFNSLTTVSVHPAILKYISAEIDYLIYEDRKKLVENSNFDYTGDNIYKYFSLISDEIRKEFLLNM